MGVAAIAGAAANVVLRAEFQERMGSTALVAGLAGAATTMYDCQNVLRADDGSEFEGVAQVG